MLRPVDAILLATVAAAAALAGCGGAPPAALRGDPEAVVRAAAGRTMAARTARVDVTVAVDTGGTGMAGTGVVDLTAGAAQMRLSRTGAEARRADTFDVVAAGPVDFVSVSAPDGAGIPGTTPRQPWVTGSPQLLAARLHTRATPLDTLLVRPALATDLAFLRGAVKVLPYGGQEIRGASTFRYSFLVDLRQAIANSPPSERPALEAAAAAIGPIRWPADVWLDASGRVRHLELAEDPEAQTTTTRGNLLIFKDTGNVLPFTDLDFYDFGTPAKISVPRSDQVVEAS